MTQTVDIAPIDEKKLENKVAISTEVTPGPGEVSWKQVLRGLAIAVFTPIIPIIQSSLAAGTFTINWITVGTTAASAALAYIFWCLTQGTKQITLFKKPKDA